ncbi:hypothetical protein SAMN05518855_1005140 [Paenibacillus sp. CF384]|nr:hypothetical protein SAMN05518855_1005140 [Paenibacillus sp. CF384]
MEKVHALAHKIPQGDADMEKKTKKKSFTIRIVRVGDRPHEVVRELVRDRIQSVLANNGVVSDNLDDVLCKYISEEMCNEQKR